MTLGQRWAAMKNPQQWEIKHYFLYLQKIIPWILLESVHINCIIIQDEMKFMNTHYNDSLLKLSKKYCKAYVLWYLLFKIHVTIKWCKLRNDQTTGASMTNTCLKWQVALCHIAFSVMRFNMLELTTGTATFTYCHESFDSPGNNCVNELLQMSPTGKNSLEFNLVTVMATQSALDIQSIFP